MNELYKNIYDIVKKVPAGKVITYGQVARLTGNPRRSRIVGFAMCGCKDKSVPCHRVVYSDGQLAKRFGVAGPELQKALLEGEGVFFLDNDVVNLKKCLVSIY